MTHLRARASVLAIFFFSGVSGLVYQVIWVRQFGNVFGNTVYSASLVAGVFMAGLGTGAYVLGKVGDRAFLADPQRPLRIYAVAELAVAGLGLLLAFGLPHLGPLAAATSTYVRGADGWYALSLGSYAARYAVAIALVAPATFLMGGTLTLLVRAVVRSHLEGASRRIGELYGANTAGAALGALLTDQALVPALGIFRTELVAVALNALAGVAALALARRPSTDPEPARSEVPPVDASRPALAETAVALVLSGFAAMGFEILWFRHLSCALGATRAVFSLLLAVILTGIGGGAVLGSWLHRRFGRPALLLLAAECALVVTTLTTFAFLDPGRFATSGFVGLRDAFVAAPRGERAAIELWLNLRPILATVLLPSVLMGVSYPLANASVQRARASLAGRAGLLYLANSLGNVLGCVLVGFVLLPALGVQHTALVLAASAAASAVPLYLSQRVVDGPDGSLDAMRFLAVAGGAAVIALCGFAALPATRIVDASLPPLERPDVSRVLDVREGVNETVAVTDMPGYYRGLVTDGHAMSSTHPKAQRYMRAFAHVPLLQMDEPRSVLVICFGVGSTTNAASLHRSVTRLDVADLSQNVLEHAAFFDATNHGVLADPRVSVFVNDGRQHLAREPEGTYDLITLEPPPIAYAGVAALYSREFYALARSRLKPGGFLTQWLPAYQVPEERVRSVVRAFIDVFPESVLLSGSNSELILMGTTAASIRMDPEAVERRLRGEPAVEADLRRVDLGDLTEIAGMFAASYATMARATATSLPVTDDRPSLEYSIRSWIRDYRIPGDLFDVSTVDAWCPACLARLPRLADYLALRGAIYRTDWFLETSSVRSIALDVRSVPRWEETVAASPYLQVLIGGPELSAKRVALANLRAGRWLDAEEGLEWARYYEPNDPDTYDQLARVFEALGKPQVAARAAATAREIRAALAAPRQ